MSLYLYRKFRVIGTIVHELAHALTVKLCGGTIDDLDITSHVNHRGHYNLGHQIAISYAPLIVNTALAALLAKWAITMSPSGLPQTITSLTSGLIPVAITTIGLQVLALGVAFPIASAALPSYQDARNPFMMFHGQLKQLTLLRILVFPVAVVVLALCVVPLVFAYLRSRSLLLNLMSELAFGTVVLLQATGLFVVIDPAAVLSALVG